MSTEIMGKPVLTDVHESSNISPVSAGTKTLKSLVPLNPPLHIKQETRNTSVAEYLTLKLRPSKVTPFSGINSEFR